MSGRFVISLDLELMWGVRDRRGVLDYGDAILGERNAIPKILELFRQYGIRATWATVGFLFARNRDEIRDFSPTLHPGYTDERLSPYNFIADGLGRDEKDDPLHFGRSLVDRIGETEGQEIATHTFSHFYCLEAGTTLQSFDADLRAARRIAAVAGYELKSLVFPRNQMADSHVSVAAQNGISVIRRNPAHFAYQPRARKNETAAVRGFKLLDSVLPLAGRMDFPAPRLHQGVIDVPASRFLRPFYSQMPAHSALHVRHVKREMGDAARKGRIYHLWWHPHNMGRHTDRALANLRTLLDHFQRLEGEYGFRSVCMADFAAR